jgi:hypothetical protein
VLSSSALSSSLKREINILYDTDLRIAKHKELANEVFNILAFAETQNLSTSKNKAKQDYLIA